MRKSIFWLELKKMNFGASGGILHVVQQAIDVRNTTCCSAGHRCELAIGPGISSLVDTTCLRDFADFVYDGNEQMCDETKTTEKQYLALGVDDSFEEHSERSN